MFRKICLAIAALIIACSLLYAQEATDKEARLHYEKGKIYYQQGYYAQAIEEFQKALAITKQHADKVDKARAQEAVTPVKQPKAEKPVIETESRILPESSSTEYYIDNDDILDISVWKVPDLSRPDVIVRPDGRISLPLVGDVPAVGVTLTELGKELTRR